MEDKNIEQITLKNIVKEGSIWTDVTYHNVYEIVEETTDSNPHIHSCYEIYLNITGDMSFAVENSVYPISYGDVIITKPNEFHHSIFHNDCWHEHYCMWINTNSEFSHLLSFISNRKNGESNLISMPMAEKEKFVNSFINLYKLSIENKTNIESIYSLFNILFLLSKYHTSTIPAIKFPAKFNEILKYIDKNYASDCNVNQISERFFISRSTLIRQFRKHLNISPSKYVELRRLSIAKELLLQGESVQNVCTKCGFSDYSHFIALFHKKIGITPYKYSKANKKETN